MPKISVVVPVYNVEQYINRCVNSIIDQTCTDFELILVDDGSPDNCGKICDEYAERDNRIHVIHQDNGGLSAARNAGIDWTFANSDSEWITFIDSDDWIHPKYLESLLSAVNNSGCEIAVASYKRCEQYEAPEVQNEILFEECEVENHYCENLAVMTTAWGKLYKKTLFHSVRYPFGVIHEDEYITYRLLFQYKKVAITKTPTYYYFDNPKGIMNTLSILSRMQVTDAFRERILFFKNNGYDKAYMFSINEYIDYLSYNISEIEKERPCSYIKPYRKELQRILIKHRKDIVYNLNDNEFIYRTAFPTEMKIRRFFRKKYYSLIGILRSKK